MDHDRVLPRLVRSLPHALPVMIPAGGWFGLKWPRPSYLEPVLAFLALCIVVTGRLMPTEDNALFWVVDLALPLVAIFAAASPLISAGIAFLLMALLIASGDGLASVGFVALYVHAFALVRLQIRHRWWMIAALVIVAQVAFVVETHTFLGEAIASAVMLLVGVVLATVGGVAWRKLAAARAQERELAQHRLHTLRLALARDLHDTVAQSLSQIAMRAYVAAGDSAEPDTQNELNALASECNEAADDLRQLLTVLRDLELADGFTEAYRAPSVPLDMALETQRDRLLAAGLEPDLELDVGPLTPTQSATLVHIMHEAVTNMIKHADRGGTCAIRFHSTPSLITAEFTNPANAPRADPTGMGLVGIRERAILLGGSKESGLQDGVWRLAVTLPRTRIPEGPATNRDLTASAR